MKLVYPTPLVVGMSRRELKHELKHFYFLRFKPFADVWLITGKELPVKKLDPSNGFLSKGSTCGMLISTMSDGFSFNSYCLCNRIIFPSGSAKFPVKIIIPIWVMILRTHPVYWLWLDPRFGLVRSVFLVSNRE